MQEHVEALVPVDQASRSLIAICDIIIADCYMTFAEKFRYLRTVEGHLRGLGRDMTQQEIVRAISKELKGKDQPTLSFPDRERKTEAPYQLEPAVAGEIL